MDESGESHRFLRAEGCEVIIGELTRGIGMTREALMGIGSGADVLMGATIRGGLLDRDFFEKFPDTKTHRHSSGHPDNHPPISGHFRPLEVRS